MPIPHSSLPHPRMGRQDCSTILAAYLCRDPGKQFGQSRHFLLCPAPTPAIEMAGFDCVPCLFPDDRNFEMAGFRSAPFSDPGGRNGRVCHAQLTEYCRFVRRKTGNRHGREATKDTWAEDFRPANDLDPKDSMKTKAMNTASIEHREGPSPTHDLTDKRVVVVGGKTGIGLGVARAAQAAGANVVVASRRLRLHEKGGKEHEMPVHHLLEQILNEYVETAGLRSGQPLFQSVNSAGTAVTGRALNRYNAWAAIRKRAKAAGFLTPVGCHT